MRFIHLTYVLTVSASLLGCAGERMDQQGSPAWPTSDAPNTAAPSAPLESVSASEAKAQPVVESAAPVGPMGTPVGTAPPAEPPRPSPPASPEALDDGKILEVAHVANAGEIEQAKLAAQRATDPRVRELAQSIVAETKQADDRGSRLAKERNLAPMESLTSSQLKYDAQQVFDNLSAKTGRAFDVAYLEARADAQQSALRLFDQKLIPEASDAYVKSLVRGIRPGLAKRFEATKSLQAKIKE